MVSKDEIEEIMDVLVPQDGEYYDDGISDYVPPVRSYEAVPRQTNTVAPDEQSRTDDYNYARDIMADAIEKGNEAFTEALKVAIETKSPRCFEVTAALMSNVTSTAKELLNLSHTQVKVEKEATQAAADDANPDETRNIIHVGSTEELARLLGPRKVAVTDAIVVDGNKEEDNEKTNKS